MPNAASSPGPGSGSPGFFGDPVAFRHLVRVARVVTATGSAEKQFRLLQVSGVLLAMSGIGSTLLAAWLGAADAADIIALRVMAYGCWLYGGLGLYHLLSPHALRDEPDEFCRLRGHETSSVFLRGVAFSRRLAIGMCLAGLPGLIAALCVSPQASIALQRTGLVLVALFYLLSLSLFLGALGAFATRAAPRAPRTFALALVLGPFLLSFPYEGVPSLVGIYSWGLSQMIGWGAAA
jgi:hypothetical protein